MLLLAAAGLAASELARSAAEWGAGGVHIEAHCSSSVASCGPGMQQQCVPEAGDGALPALLSLPTLTIHGAQRWQLAAEEGARQCQHIGPPLSHSRLEGGGVGAQRAKTAAGRRRGREAPRSMQQARTQCSRHC